MVPTRSEQQEVKCFKCSVGVKAFVTCTNCKNNSNPTCALRIEGIFVDKTRKTNCGKEIIIIYIYKL